LIINSARRSGWYALDEREAIAALMVEYAAGRKVKRRTLVGNIVDAVSRFAMRAPPSGNLTPSPAGSLHA
jgi:hypothetical protein